jgi:hypothetical protein
MRPGEGDNYEDYGGQTDNRERDAVQSAAVATSSASPRGRHVGAPFVNVDAG